MIRENVQILYKFERNLKICTKFEFVKIQILIQICYKFEQFVQICNTFEGNLNDSNLIQISVTILNKVCMNLNQICTNLYNLYKI